MSRTYSIHRKVPYAKLRTLIPRRYQTQPLPRAGSAGYAALIIFRHDRMIVCSHVRRALLGFEDADEDLSIAAGYCFTREGLLLLASRDFRVLSSRSLWNWTDASYQEIFQIRLSELGS